GPQITLSRSHPNLVRRLFDLEVPEVAHGTVEITGRRREAGHRTKMSVRATVPGVNAKGSCIGPMGGRVRAVMNELGGEKIDIVDFDEDPAAYITNALSPSRVTSVTVLDEAGRSARAVVPETQLSLAIGKDGQNARLAAKLTGWKIDIRPDGPGEPTPAGGGVSRASPLRSARRRSATLGRLFAGPGGASSDARARPSGGARNGGGGMVARSSHRPERTCVGCRQAAPRADLVRLVREPAPGGAPPRVRVDPSGAAPGRGSWLHPDV